MTPAHGTDHAYSEPPASAADVVRTGPIPARLPVDACGLAAAVLGCPQVSALHTGPLGTIATDSPTGLIRGVVISQAMILLGVVISPHIDRDHLARRIRARLARLAPDVPVTLSIATAI